MLKRSYGKDKLAMLVMAGAFCLFYIIAGQYPQEVALYPKGICLLAIALCILQAAIIAYNERRGNKIDAIVQLSLKDIRKVILAFISLVIYGVLIPKIGYVVTTFLYMGIIAFWVNPKKPLYSYVAVAVGTVAVLYVIFKIILKIPLPYGIPI